MLKIAVFHASLHWLWINPATAIDLLLNVDSQLPVSEVSMLVCFDSWSPYQEVHSYQGLVLLHIKSLHQLCGALLTQRWSKQQWKYFTNLLAWFPDLLVCFADPLPYEFFLPLLIFLTCQYVNFQTLLSASLAQHWLLTFSATLWSLQWSPLV